MTTIEELASDTTRTRLLVIDSGVGGLAYVAHLLSRRDNFTIGYVADTAGFPYGEKESDWLRSHLLSLVGAALIRFPADLVLLACNTASVTALAALRDRFAVPFIGTVPAVKPAARLTRSGVIGLLATSATVGDDYTDRLVGDFASEFRVVRSGASELVREIEGGFPDLSRTPRVDRLIREELEAFRKSGADVVVLGCTHFLHITPLITEIARTNGSGCTLVDSLDGVSRRVITLARKEQLATVRGFGRALVKPGRYRGAQRSGPSTEEEPTGILMTTSFAGAESPAPERYESISTSFRLVYAGDLQL